MGAAVGDGLILLDTYRSASLRYAFLIAACRAGSRRQVIHSKMGAEEDGRVGGGEGEVCGEGGIIGGAEESVLVKYLVSIAGGAQRGVMAHRSRQVGGRKGLLSRTFCGSWG